MRCTGCNIVLPEGRLSSRNKHTGEFEDLCALCSSPSWDTGLTYARDEQGNITTKVASFHNEAWLTFPPGCDGVALNNAGDIQVYIGIHGKIGVESFP